MLVDGWPLSKISKDFQHAEFEEILSLITDDLANNDALDLIESFKTATPDQSGRAQVVNVILRFQRHQRMALLRKMKAISQKPSEKDSVKAWLFGKWGVTSAMLLNGTSRSYS